MILTHFNLISPLEKMRSSGAMMLCPQGWHFNPPKGKQHPKACIQISGIRYRHAKNFVSNQSNVLRSSSCAFYFILIAKWRRRRAKWHLKGEDCLLNNENNSMFLRNLLVTENRLRFHSLVHRPYWHQKINSIQREI